MLVVWMTCRCIILVPYPAILCVGCWDYCSTQVVGTPCSTNAVQGTLRSGTHLSTTVFNIRDPMRMYSSSQALLNANNLYIMLHQHTVGQPRFPYRIYAQYIRATRCIVLKCVWNAHWFIQPIWWRKRWLNAKWLVDYVIPTHCGPNFVQPM